MLSVFQPTNSVATEETAEGITEEPQGLIAMMGLPNISRFIPLAIHNARAPAIRRPSVHWALLNFIFILLNLIIKNTLLGVGERSVPEVTECHCLQQQPNTFKTDCKNTLFFQFIQNKIKNYLLGLSVTNYRQVYFKPLFLITT